MDDMYSDKEIMSRIVVNEEVPGWVRELEPIKKLKTNVGSKIRNCINNSLAKEPPEWARLVLDNSISKEFTRPMLQALLSSVEGNKGILHLDSRAFFKHGNCEEGILGSPAIISSLLNFRMIDMRLASGAYCGSHEALLRKYKSYLVLKLQFWGNVLIVFENDSQLVDLAKKSCRVFESLYDKEFWRNVLIVFGNDSQLVDSAKKSCRVFESLYDKEVVALYQKLINDQRPEWFNDALNKDLGNIAVPTHDSKGSWGEGFCKVCGIDENNKKVLLCDTCDAEYHTYCLRPPLTKVPKGNWFCSFCGPKDTVQDSHLSPTSSIHEQEKKPKGGIMNLIRNEIGDLAVAMREKNYWELSFYE
ncbi:Methyl-CpG-binding domain-containing protein 9, partial [Sesamum angolense]